MPQEIKEKISKILKDFEYTHKTRNFDDFVNQILELFSQEYKNGYNQALKDQKLTGEKYQQLYL